MTTDIAIRPTGYKDGQVFYSIPTDKLLWVDADAAGKILHPESKDPADTVQKIYNRNKQHFTDRDTMLLDVDMEHLRVDLQGQSVPACPSSKVSKRRQKVRFFSIPYGINKLNLFSQSNRKAQIADWIQDIYSSYQNGTLPRWDKSIASIAHIPKWQRGRGEAIRQIAQESGVSTITIRRHIEKMKKGEPINKNCPGMKGGYCHSKYRGIKEEVIRLAYEGMKAKEISERLNVPLKTVYRWI